MATSIQFHPSCLATEKSRLSFDVAQTGRYILHKRNDMISVGYLSVDSRNRPWSKEPNCQKYRLVSYDVHNLGNVTDKKYINYISVKG